MSRNLERALGVAISYWHHWKSGDETGARQDLETIETLVGSWEWDETAGKHRFALPAIVNHTMQRGRVALRQVPEYSHLAEVQS